MDKNTTPKSKEVQLFKEWLCISIPGISLSLLSNLYKHPSSGLLDKLGLLSSDSASKASLDKIDKFEPKPVP